MALKALPEGGALRRVLRRAGTGRRRTGAAAGCGQGRGEQDGPEHARSGRPARRAVGQVGQQRLPRWWRARARGVPQARPSASPHAVNGAGLAISLRLPTSFLSGAPRFPPPRPAFRTRFRRWRPAAGGRRPAAGCAARHRRSGCASATNCRIRSSDRSARTSPSARALSWPSSSSSRPATRSGTPSRALRKITGTSGSDDRLRRTTSNPPPFGIITSSRTRSGFDAAAARSACVPRSSPRIGASATLRTAGWLLKASLMPASPCHPFRRWSCRSTSIPTAPERSRSRGPRRRRCARQLPGR